MTCCETCRSWLGLVRRHEGECPVRTSAWCSQCGCYGHRPADCEKQMMWTRPRTLEELIPSDVRERWEIDTTTNIVWLPAGLEDAEREIAENNTIEIRYREGRMDNKIREVMKANRIVTVHKMDGNLQKLRTWAVGQGKKIRLVQEK